MYLFFQCPTRRLLRFLITMVSAFIMVCTIPALARNDVRELKLYFIHTGERATITYKRNGVFLPAGLKRINHMLRDWRRNEPTRMNPKLLDLLWAVYQKSGSKSYIHVLSGYRSPKTNEFLRKHTSGVAKHSQHTKGNAIDFYLPDVPLAKLHAIGLKFHGGGVGHYPNSGSPFVHLDVGSVRHWPRMTRTQLARVFPDGRTLHIPADGRKMRGYDIALAQYRQNAHHSYTQLAMHVPEETQSSPLPIGKKLPGTYHLARLSPAEVPSMRPHHEEPSPRGQMTAFLVNIRKDALPEARPDEQETHGLLVAALAPSPRPNIPRDGARTNTLDHSELTALIAQNTKSSHPKIPDPPDVPPTLLAYSEISPPSPGETPLDILPPAFFPEKKTRKISSALPENRLHAPAPTFSAEPLLLKRSEALQTTLLSQIPVQQADSPLARLHPPSTQQSFLFAP